MWSIKFLNQKVIDEFEAVNSDLQAKLLKLFERVKIYGPNLGEPHTKNLESGLFELRAKAASGIARSIFCYSDGKTIVKEEKIRLKLEKNVFLRALGDNNNDYAYAYDTKLKKVVIINPYNNYKIVYPVN